MPPPRERRFFFMILILFLLVVSVPYLYAARAAGPGFVFGGFLLNPIDGNSYLAKMVEGWRGDWNFTLPYTAEAGRASFLFLFYLLLGHLGRWLGISLVLTFHLARLFSSGVLLFVLFKFFKSVLPDWRAQSLAFVLAAFGSGLGWIVAASGLFTPDFWVAEAYPFLSAYANPHFPLGLALMVWLLMPGKGDKKPGLLVFLASIALAIIAPFGVVLAIVILSGVLAFELLQSGLYRRPLFPLQTGASESFHNSRLWLILLGSLPVLLYEVWVTRSDPLLSSWNAQNLTPSPAPWDLLLSLSPALMLAVAGVWAALNQKNRTVTLLLVWIGASLLLLYLPTGLQRRFMMGIYIPLAALAALGVDAIVRRWGGGQIQPRRYRFLSVLVLLAAIPTNLVILLAAFHGVQTHDPLLYLTRGEDQAFHWIMENTPPGALIMAAPETGLFLPARTGRRVIYGHPFETANAGVEKAVVTDYYGKEGQPPELLTERGVNYVFLGPREIALNPKFHASGLPLTFESEGVQIYSVNP